MIVFTSSFNLTSPGVKVHVKYCHLFTSIFAECSIHYLFTLIFCVSVNYCYHQGILLPVTFPNFQTFDISKII